MRVLTARDTGKRNTKIGKRETPVSTNRTSRTVARGKARMLPLIALEAFFGHIARIAASVENTVTDRKSAAWQMLTNAADLRSEFEEYVCHRSWGGDQPSYPLHVYLNFMAWLAGGVEIGAPGYKADKLLLAPFRIVRLFLRLRLWGVRADWQ